MKPSPYQRPVPSGDAETIQELLREIKQLKSRVAYLEALDKYDPEWTTFVPSATGSTGAGTFTYAIRTGRYTRIGNTVFFQVFIQISAVTVAATGNATITGLPYTSTSATNSDFALAVEFNSALTASYTVVNAYVQENSTLINLIESGSSLRQALPASRFAANFLVRIAGLYQAAA